VARVELMVKIVQIARWFSMGTVVGANSTGGEGRFQYEAMGIWNGAAAWLPRREGGKGCNRADMGRSSTAPLHDCALRMSCGKTHRDGRKQPRINAVRSCCRRAEQAPPYKGKPGA
jgi:hypothetical protein